MNYMEIPSFNELVFLAKTINNFHVFSTSTICEIFVKKNYKQPLHWLEKTILTSILNFFLIHKFCIVSQFYPEPKKEKKNVVGNSISAPTVVSVSLPILSHVTYDLKWGRG